jgi:hypothetical protein
MSSIVQCTLPWTIGDDGRIIFIGSSRIRVGGNSFRIATGGHDIELTMTKKAHHGGHGGHGGDTADTEKDLVIRAFASTMPGRHATGGGRMLSMDHPVPVLLDE